MSDLNKAMLIGRLGNDPEVRYLDNGTCVANFSIATGSKWKDKEGNPQERTEWHRIVAWGKLGEICGEYLTKGRQVFIEGEIRYEKFTGNDGVEKYSTKIIASTMQMLGPNPNAQSGDGDAQQSRQGGGHGGSRPASTGGNRQQGQRNSPPPQSRNDEPFPDDDIPF